VRVDPGRREIARLPARVLAERAPTRLLLADPDHAPHRLPLFFTVGAAGDVF
jgi:hypothetical protein